ncbi:MAG: nucleotidyltransferase family protein [Candidatus Micrarchaeota archaeon]
MKAFVLCGGKGTRLRPHTYTIPKPMLTLGKRPILQFVIGNLFSSGITDLILTVGYLKDQIIGYFGDGKKFGVNITYSEEDHRMNTAGSILPNKKDIDSTFVVVMGDHLTLIDIKKMVKHHKKTGAIATIGLKQQGIPIEYGVAEIGDDGFITGFKEKPILKNYVNTGVYIFEPEIFDYISPNDDFAKDVFPKLLDKKKKIASYIIEEYWIDIGRIHDYERLDQTLSIFDLASQHKDK